MRWSIVFAYLAAVTLVALLLGMLLGWTGWLLLVVVLLMVPAVVFLGISTRHSVRWSSVLTYLSAFALLGAVISQLMGWPGARSWFLLSWAVLLLSPVVSLFSHPMRKPAWGLFVSFWGVVAVLWLIAIQLLNLWDVLLNPAYGEWAAWPLAVIGISLFVASASGCGCESVPVPVDVLGMITGAAIVAISVGIWVGSPELMRAAGGVAAIAYFLWALGFGWAVWSIQRPARRFGRMTAQPQA